MRRLAALILPVWSAAASAAPGTDDPVAQLVGRLQAGELRLEWKAPRGYLDSLLAELDVDPSSQLLVFSRTSLQAAYISSTTPRAIYFNDHVYVAWVQGSDDFELVSIDAARGPQFYSVHNVPAKPPAFARETVRCLACHDSAGMKPGGYARVLVRSAPVEQHMNPANRVVPIEVTHATPIEDRWGGWYVTGSLGTQLHLGNLPLAGPPDPVVRGIHNRSNLDGLASHFDTGPYHSDKSDIVALLVMEHQSYVNNLLTRAHAELRDRIAATEEWQALDPARQAALRAALDPLVHAMTFQDEQRLFSRVRGGSGFQQHFSARGPRDPAGRSLREFELTRRTFRYPLSYLVYSRQFATLPLAARQYAYRAFAGLLTAPSGDEALDADRRAALEILAATVPESSAFVPSRR